MESPSEQPPPRQLLGTVTVLGSGAMLRLQVDRAQFGLSASDSSVRATEAAAMFDALSERLSNSQAEQLQQHFLALLEQKRDYERSTVGLREHVQRAIKLRRRDDLPALHALLDRTSQIGGRVSQRLVELQRLIEDILASPVTDPARRDLATGSALGTAPFPGQLERRLGERRSVPREPAVGGTPLRGDRRSRLSSVLGNNVTLTGRTVICRLEACDNGRIALSLDAPHAVRLIDGEGTACTVQAEQDGSLTFAPPRSDAQLLIDSPPGYAIALHRSV